MMKLIKNQIDQQLWSWGRQKTLNHLWSYYKLDPVFLEHNEPWFTSWTSVVVLGAKKLDKRFNDAYSQAGLMGLLFDMLDQFSYTQMAIKLKMKRSAFIQMQRKIKNAIRLHIPYLISLGIGLRLMILLEEEHKVDLYDILREFKIPYELAELDNRFNLAWED